MRWVVNIICEEEEEKERERENLWMMKKKWLVGESNLFICINWKMFV